MARSKLEYYLSVHPSMPKAMAEQIFVDVMAVGSSVDRQGNAVLQKVGRRCTFRKSMHNTKEFKRNKYEAPDEMAEATFTPRIGRSPRKTQYRSKSVKSLKADLTSWQ